MTTFIFSQFLCTRSLGTIELDASVSMSKLQSESQPLLWVSQGPGRERIHFWTHLCGCWQGLVPCGLLTEGLRTSLAFDWSCPQISATARGSSQHGWQLASSEQVREETPVDGGQYRFIAISEVTSDHLCILSRAEYHSGRRWHKHVNISGHGSLRCYLSAIFLIAILFLFFSGNTNSCWFLNSYTSSLASFLCH